MGMEKMFEVNWKTMPDDAKADLKLSGLGEKEVKRIAFEGQKIISQRPKSRGQMLKMVNGLKISLEEKTFLACSLGSLLATAEKSSEAAKMVTRGIIDMLKKKGLKAESLDEAFNEDGPISGGIVISGTDSDMGGFFDDMDNTKKRTIH